MNSWLDRGLFLLVLYILTYFIYGGKPPTWDALFAGAVGLVIIGLIIQAAKAGWIK